MTEGSGLHSADFITSPLTATTYYRAQVFQPGYDAVYANTVSAEVIPTTPVVTASGDALHSTATEGNQWYNLDGPIDGATGQDFLALEPGTYYVIVTTGDCVSAPSNSIELITVSAVDPKRSSWIKLYPNPATTSVYLSGPEIQDGSRVKLYTIEGKEIRSEVLAPESGVSVKNLLPGLYIMVLERTDGREVLRFYKE